MCTIVLFLFYLIVLTGVKCWTPDWPRWIFVKISERKAHVLWGRFTAIITKRSPLHLPHANWWQANQQHAPKTTVPLCWHSFCSLAFFSLSSLCLSAFFSPSLWPHLSLFLFHLVVFCIFITFFFLLLSSFSPLLLLFPLLLSLFSRSSLHPRPCGPGEVAGWQKPDPLVSQVPYLAYEVLPCMCTECLCVCERGAVLEGKVRCERMMHLIHCEERRKKWGKRVEGETSRGREGGGGQDLSCLRWVRLLLDPSLVIREPCGSQWK